jgi:hypothetical protein
MKHIKTYKINPVYLRPGDSINLDYTYEEPKGVVNRRCLTIDTIEEPMMVDTVIVYKSGNGAFGLKVGRVLVMGEDDGTYKDVPISTGRKILSNGRYQNV